jgi:hypothetical protein
VHTEAAHRRHFLVLQWFSQCGPQDQHAKHKNNHQAKNNLLTDGELAMKEQTAKQELIEAINRVSKYAAATTTRFW